VSFEPGPKLGATYGRDKVCEFLVWAPQVERLDLHLISPRDRRVVMHRESTTKRVIKGSVETRVAVRDLRISPSSQKPSLLNRENTESTMLVSSPAQRRARVTRNPAWPLITHDWLTVLGRRRRIAPSKVEWNASQDY
jgi:hypothetical protein